MTTFRTAPRLAGFEYLGSYAYSLTLVTSERKRVFRDRAFARQSEEHLLISAGQYGFHVFAYCFMPDHLHVLVAGDQWSDLKRFAQHFKQMSGYYHKKATGEMLWQPSFWDHVLRSEEALVDVARYIWGNPVRAGLAESWRDYGFSGPRPLPDMI
jgi:putative transposase